MKKYEHIFFDLDRTLWDFDHNTLETFREIFFKFRLDEFGIPSLDEFMAVYTVYNADLWELYRKGNIEKEVLRVKRFRLTLSEFGIDDPELAEMISEDYVRLSPLKTRLFPGTKEVLDYLKEKYRLHIITNGFEEVQISKIKASGLDDYFESIITSEAAGCKKPHKDIFLFALDQNEALAEKSLMIGDDLDIDIVGAQNAGIDQVFFNNDSVNDNTATFEISSLKELKHIL